MTPLLAIAKREFLALFRTSAGWLIIALYLTLVGVWYSQQTIQPGEPASMRALFGASHWMLMLVLPAVTMRLFAEDRRTGTLEMMLTAPVSDYQLVLAKYLGCLAFLFALLAPTLLHVGFLYTLASPDPGPIIAGYAGLLCAGALYLAAGIFFSSLTRNPVVAFLCTLFFFLGLHSAISWGATAVPQRFESLVYAFSLQLRLADFAKGQIDTAHIGFFLAASLWFLVLTALSTEARRWS